jgi:hypothetical protein
MYVDPVPLGEPEFKTLVHDITKFWGNDFENDEGLVGSIIELNSVIR